LDSLFIEQELSEVSKEKSGIKELDFIKWQPDFLADYIYNQHHQYYYDEDPVIVDILNKVANHHGEKFPELKTVVLLYRKLQQELKTHFLKEEKVLFPLIKQLVAAKKGSTPLSAGMLHQIAAPLRAMEADHDAAGHLLAELNTLTNHYTPPAGACNSFKLLYSKLQALEEDLHQHIHLENNILFPKALQLEKELSKTAQYV
jgi:regulator of cell morphogenesis and NO signaling